MLRRIPWCRGLEVVQDCQLNGELPLSWKSIPVPHPLVRKLLINKHSHVYQKRVDVQFFQAQIRQKPRIESTGTGWKGRQTELWSNRRSRFFLWFGSVFWCLSVPSECVCVCVRQMMHAEGSSLYRLRALTSQRAHVKRRHRDDSDMQLMHSFEGYRLPLWITNSINGSAAQGSRTWHQPRTQIASRLREKGKIESVLWHVTCAPAGSWRLAEYTKDVIALPLWTYKKTL